MKIHNVLLVIVVLLLGSCSTVKKGTMTFGHKPWLDDSLSAIVRDCGLDVEVNTGEDGVETISLAVIDLRKKVPVMSGVHMDNFIYPASVYKMYVAMEVLKQISSGKYSLFTPYIVKAPNDVDRSSEIKWDPRPLLKAGDTVTVDYLLDLMITRSDNSASNCLIDLAGRENINKTMHEYGWYGSEVTRKFLSRKFEDPGYDTIRGTETNARHAAEFMYRIHTGQLVNEWVSKQMMSLMSRQLDTTKLAAGLPPNTMFYHKTGWWSIYTNDVGIVESKDAGYIIALFTPIAEEQAREKIRQLSSRVYKLMSR